MSLLLVTAAAAAAQSSLSKGSSLSVEDDSDLLVSPNGSFTCGFYEVGANAYVFSIWFSRSANKTIAWTANRDRPVNGRGSTVSFLGDGSVALMDVDGAVVWSTNSSSTPADSMQMSDTGNLVIKGPDGNTLWHSFDSPTDTLLPAQPITKNVGLASARARGSVSSGYYSFIFDTNNILTLIYNGPDVSSIYWPNPDYTVFQNGRSNYNSSRYGVLDGEGRFRASDGLAFDASDMSSGILRRLTLDYDGNLRLYSLNESTGMWSVSWEAFQQLCQVHGLCGRNGICTYRESETVCSCPPGYEMSNRADWRDGCRQKFDASCEKHERFKYVKLHNTDFWGYDLNYSASISLKDCKKLCGNYCSCLAIEYKIGSGDCFTKSALFNGRASPDNPGNLYLKVPRSMPTSRDAILEVQQPSCNSIRAEINVTGSQYASSSSRGIRWVYFYWFIGAIGLTELLFIASGWGLMFRREKNTISLEEGYKLISSQFKKFTLQRA